MSQYGGQQAYGQQKQAPQYGSQQSAPSQYGAPQDPSQYASQQDSNQFGNQQDPSQYGQQDLSQYGGQQDSASQYDGEDQGQPQYGQQPKPTSGKAGLVNGHEANNEHKEPNGVKQDDRKDEKKGEGNQNYKEDHDKALTRGNHGNELHKGADSRPNPGRKYHHTHMNALHHMGKAAANGFTPEHIDSLLHLLTYAGGTLANTHGLAPSAPVEADD